MPTEDERRFFAAVRRAGSIIADGIAVNIVCRVGGIFIPSDGPNPDEPVVLVETN